MRNVRSNDRSCHGLLLRKEKLDSGCFSCASLRIPTVDQPQNPPHPRSPGRQWPNGSYRLRPHPPTFWTLPRAGRCSLAAPRYVKLRNCCECCEYRAERCRLPENAVGDSGDWRHGKGFSPAIVGKSGLRLTAVRNAGQIRSQHKRQRPSPKTDTLAISGNVISVLQDNDQRDNSPHPMKSVAAASRLRSASVSPTVSRIAKSSCVCFGYSGATTSG